MMPGAALGVLDLTKRATVAILKMVPASDKRACQPEMGADMINFWSSFCSYGILMLITVAVCGIGIFLGITLRKKKNAETAGESAPAEKEV